MNKVISIFIYILFLYGCKSVNEANISFNPGQHTRIELVVNNFQSEENLSFFYFQTFPYDQKNIILNLSTDTTVILDIDLNHPLYIDLYVRNEHAVLFCLPDDTLSVNIDHSESDGLLKSISFDGNTGSISHFLTFDRFYPKYRPSYDLSIDDYNKTIDYQYDKCLNKLDSLGNSKILPRWFVKLENINIKHERESQKLHQFYERYYRNKTFIPRNAGFLDKIDIKDMDYYWLFNTNRLLACYVPDKYDSLLQPGIRTNDILMECCQDNFYFLKNRIPDEVLSFFVASRISMFYKEKSLLKLSPGELKIREQKIDNLISKNKTLISDTILYNLLVKTKSKIYDNVANRIALESGENAPDFYLSDPEGNFQHLSDYKGKLVLLNFWGTYCAPCINNIEEENRLVNKFRSDSFVLINICMDSKTERWKNLIKTHNYRGIHLICKGNWEKILRDRYNIYGIPHYTLVDKDGKIIQNDINKSLEGLIEINL